MSIGVVDIGIGNIGSLQGALYSQGWETVLVRTPEKLAECSHLIIPGVGSFYEGMRRLDESGLTNAIRDFANRGYPLLGICLGMQLLADYGDEGGGRTGLAIIPGKICQLRVSPQIRLPHVGWNTMSFKPHPILEGVKPDVDYYFVHSYFFDQAPKECQLSITSYGVDFTSCVAQRNIVGVQFHPEKSQRNGLRLLDNFCGWDGIA